MQGRANCSGRSNTIITFAAWPGYYGKKLISSSYGLNRIFDTTTWQDIVLEVTDLISAGNQCLLASASSWVYGILAPTSKLDHPSSMNEICDMQPFRLMNASITGCEGENVYT
ncbi:hypothetical protein BDR04DRAFT_1108055 [Suillus decipiens]|nr:hypothetical protein BDR04DRAFT_1108055 [Suillus decipiens]